MWEMTEPIEPIDNSTTAAEKFREAFEVFCIAIRCHEEMLPYLDEISELLSRADVLIQSLRNQQLLTCQREAFAHRLRVFATAVRRKKEDMKDERVVGEKWADAENAGDDLLQVAYQIYSA